MKNMMKRLGLLMIAAVIVTPISIFAPWTTIPMMLIVLVWIVYKTDKDARARKEAKE